MTQAKVAPPFDPESALPSLIKALRARGVLKKADLKALKVPTPDQDRVLGRLEGEGFEAVKGGVRVPLSLQIMTLVQERGVLGWPLGKQVKGATPRECKAAVMDLAREGSVHLLVRGKVEAIAGRDTPALGRDEMRALGQLVVSVQKAMRAKPLPHTLLREDVRELLLDLVQPPHREAAAQVRPGESSLVERLVRETLRLRVPESGLCPVPELVLACLPDHSLTRIHEALFQAVRERRIELRPEAGMDRLGELELALCPAGLQETRLSWARILEPAP